MSFKKWALILCSITFFGHSESFSNPRKTQNNKNSKKTIGQLLKQADRGAGVNLGEKRGFSIPVGQAEVGGPLARPVDLSRVKPPRTSVFYTDANSDQAKLERITDQQINELFKLTQRFKSSPQRGELWLRLAELYVEKAGVIDFRKQNEFDSRLKDFQEGRTKTRPVLDLNDAREFNKKAIQLYDWFLRDFPKDDKIDQALFFLGYNNYEIGNLKKGTEYYQRLTKEFPRSPYVTEANFALAEYFFENEKWADAKKAYAEVLKRRRHRLYTFSLYKTAWCEFRMGDSTRALKTMETLVRQAKSASEEESEGRKAVNKNRLESEGLRDIVLFYAEAGKAEQAPQYFRSIAGQDYRSYLERLAYYYGDKGNLVGARSVFTHLIQDEPTNAKAFDFKYQVVKLYSTARRSREFRDELFSWVRDFGVAGAWYQANQGNSELVQNAVRLRETTLKNYVLQQHQTAQNSRAPFSQGLAVEGYRLYLGEFKDSAAYADMQFYFGELLYDMKRYDEASQQYRWVVENGEGTKFHALAGENIIIALEKDLPKDEEIASRVGQSLDPVAFDARIARFVDTSNWYLGKFPQSEKALELKFRVGRLYYQHNQFDQAVPIFREIVEKHPRTKYAEFSANLLLDIFNLRKDYEGLSRVGQELLNNPSLSGTKAGSDIRGVLEKASFKQAQDLEVSKNFGGSALQFEAFAKQNPTSPLYAAALFNSAVNFERAGDNSGAVRNHQLVLSASSKEAKDLQPKSKRLLAKLYQDSGQLEKAANLYREVAVEAKNDPLAPNFYFNAAVLFEAVGRPTQAIQNYRAYYDSTRSSERIDAIYQIATIHRKQGQWSAALEKYEEYLQLGGGTAEKNIESAYWLHEGSQRLKRASKALEWKNRTLSLQKRAAPQKKGVGAQYAAKIELAEARDSAQQLINLKIPSNPADQQRVVQQKLKMMTDLNTKLGSVIQYDSPAEIVGALSLLGQTNQHMYEALIGTPIPKGLTPEQVDQYKSGVAQIANPFAQKARESFQAAIEKGMEFENYGVDYRRAVQAMKVIEPTAIYDGGEAVSDVRLGSWVGL